MAVLPDADRAKVRNHWMRINREVYAALTKADLQAALDATDDWIDTNQATYNLALPLAARTNLSVTQKTFLFCLVAMRRATFLPTDEG